MDDGRLPEIIDDRAAGYAFEDLAVGLTATFSKTVTDADIVMFAGVSGDTNPVHIDELYAQNTMFKGRIAHGMLGAAYISTVLGTRLPGPGAIYLSQTLKFRAPVRVGDTVTARVTVVELIEAKNRASMRTAVTVGTTVVIEGEAMVFVPSRQA